MNKNLMLQLVNNERQKAGVKELVWDSRLEKVAQLQSEFMASCNSCTHASDSGNLGTRVEAQGFSWSGCAENVAEGYKDEESVVKGWLTSSGHKNNMLNPKYTHFGAGHQKGFWAQVYGSEL
ncbi:CAP domain-containing protein [Gigaspora rosea]|uniref:CAP domain-containing protein n=1 Tax=Gigaspora rosea TaxID=44941 RepID=A0A397V631_9GLOM|nr:CAP domain-containing protein [Gigaspora rosea]